MLEDGREVRFLNDAQGKPVRIELHDRTGLLRTLTVTEAMELVAGASEL
jgi:small nuclear ribonucleoprotein (snRNP)-like protein